MKLTLAQKCDRRNKANKTAATRAGRPVKSVEELACLARDHRSVFCATCWGLLPAVVVMNMSAAQVHGAIQFGSIHRYNP